MHLLPTPLKTSGNLTVFWCFQEVEKDYIGREGYYSHCRCCETVLQNIVLRGYTDSAKNDTELAESSIFNFGNLVEILWHRV